MTPTIVGFIILTALIIAQGALAVYLATVMIQWRNRYYELKYRYDNLSWRYDEARKILYDNKLPWSLSLSPSPSPEAEEGDDTWTA